MDCESSGNPVVRNSEQSLPAAIRWAAGSLIAYGVVLLASATVLQIHNGWQEAANYPPKVVGTLGVVAVSWGLMHRMRWAWWSGIGLALFVLVGGGFALAMFLIFRPTEWDALMAPQGAYLMLGIPIALLAIVIILLLLPRSRAAFRRRSA